MPVEWRKNRKNKGANKIQRAWTVQVNIKESNSKTRTQIFDL